MKVLVATEKAFTTAALRQIHIVINAAGFELSLLENYKNADDLKASVADVDALIVRSDLITREIIEAGKNLKIVVRAGAGYDNLDLTACSDHHIVAMNTPGQNSNAVAELAFSMMLFQARNGFEGKSGTELRRKSLGIHAFGNVAKHMAEIGKGFGMEIYTYDPFVTEKDIKKYGVIVCNTTEDLYSKCQYISLHMPSNDNTKRSIGYDLLKKMPKNAVLINTARKEIIDEEGLLKVFEERPDFRYLADVAPDCRPVFEEKYKGRFIFTAKKMGAQTEEANMNAGVAAARQIVDFFKTGNIKYKVN